MLIRHRLGDSAIESALLSALQGSVDLITPSDPMCADLHDVKPVYSATFIFADAAGNLRLAIEWQEAQDVNNTQSSFEELSRKWTRLERDTGTPTQLLDVSLTDLTTGLAWQFDILASQPVDEARVPPGLVEYAKKLQFNLAIAKEPSSNKPFVRIINNAALRSYQQRTSYRYTLANSDFKLELSRFQDAVYPAPTVYEPRWSLGLYRSEWDTMFSANERLGVGKQTGWPDDLEAWFPRNVGPGCSSPTGEDEAQLSWDQLMEKLERIGGLVPSVRVEEEEEEGEEYQALIEAE